MIDNGTLEPIDASLLNEEATEESPTQTRGRITWTRLLIYKHLAKRAACNLPSILRDKRGKLKRVTVKGESKWKWENRETMPIYLRQFVALKPIGFVHVDKSIFTEAIRPDLMHRAVTYIMNLRRQGTHSTKTRGEVAGSNRKLRPQKGTGRSRMSTRKTPLHRGGTLLLLF